MSLTAEMKVAAVILNWNRAELTIRAAHSVRSQVDRLYIVDNGSRLGDCIRLKEFASESGCDFVPLASNLGYAAGNNRGIRRAIHDGAAAILVMNNDAEARAGAVAELMAHLRSTPSVGVVGPLVIDPVDCTVIHSSCSLDTGTGVTAWDDHGVSEEEVERTPRPTEYVSGDAFLARSVVFQECGLFDERLFCYFEDVDWSIRVRRGGWRLEVQPTSVFHHEVGGSGATVLAAYYRARNRILFVHWGLGRARSRTLTATAPPQAVAVARLLKRREPAAACAALAGWIAGASRIFQEPYARPVGSGGRL